MALRGLHVGTVVDNHIGPQIGIGTDLLDDPRTSSKHDSADRTVEMSTVRRAAYRFFGGCRRLQYAADTGACRFRGDGTVGIPRH